MVEMPSGYYYFGGDDMNTKEITVLMVEPGRHPKVTTLKDDLDSLQKAVSIGADYQGLIEFVSLGNGDCIMCNEEGKLIGLDKPLSMYVARHSWASIAKTEGISLSVISESMGHDSESTTQIYLASLDSSVIDKANQKIIKLV